MPNSSSRKIVTSRGNRVLTRVNELIEPVSGEPDENFIREFFWPIDVDRILQIPLHQDDTEDYVAWHLTKTGVFSVRSAYYKQWGDSYGSTEPSSLSSGSAPHPIWKKLWSLKVPNKVKIFCWRSLHNAIPCFGVLVDQHISTSAQCPVCKQHAEDVAHALSGCTRVRQIWSLLGLHEVITAARLLGKSGAKILDFLLCDKASQKSYSDVIELPELIAVTSWHFW